MQLYIIRCKDTGRIKIGVSADAQIRLQGLQDQCPTFLELVVVIPGDRFLEQRLHDRFEAHRVRSEWFAPAPELLAWIATLPRT